MMADALDGLRLPVLPVQPRPEFANALLRRLEAKRGMIVGRGATVRYFVADLDAAIEFYRGHLDFEVELHPSDEFAMLYRGDLRLILSVPGGHHVMPDGAAPQPGGWNRITLQVADLDAAVQLLRDQGARFRNEIVTGAAVRQILLQDPSGNLIELFEPMSGYRERTPSDTGTQT